MHRTEGITVLSAVILVGLGLTVVISRGLAGEQAQWAGLLWLMTGSLMAVAAAGSLWLRRGRPEAIRETAPGGPLGYVEARLPFTPLPLSAVLPALLVAGLSIFVQFFESGAVQALIVVLGGLSFAALYWAQAHTLSADDRSFGLANAVLNAVAHLAAFLLFSVLYGLKVRALYSAPAVGIVTALLIYEMLARDVNWRRAMNLPVYVGAATPLLLALAAGLVTSELTWALNYWAALTTLVGGAFLLVAFYVSYGLASHYMDRKLTRGVLAEFAAVSTLSVAAVFFFAFLS